MKLKPLYRPPANGQPRPKPRPTGRVAAVRRLEPERQQRVWSLLLPPSYWNERK